MTSLADTSQGYLFASDWKELRAGERQVWRILSDGAWHTLSELREATGLESADRRLRALRNHGFIIECRRIGPKRSFVYRMLQDRRTEPGTKAQRRANSVTDAKQVRILVAEMLHIREMVRMPAGGLLPDEGDETASILNRIERVVNYALLSVGVEIDESPFG
jgi:hypothetical protein